jgi:hypothetical protein
MAANLSRCWSDNPTVIVQLNRPKTASEKLHNLKPSGIAKGAVSQHDRFVIHRNDYTLHFCVFRNESEFSEVMDARTRA